MVFSFKQEKTNAEKALVSYQITKQLNYSVGINATICTTSSSNFSGQASF